MALSGEDVQKFFLKAQEKDSLNHAYIFVGPPGSGKFAQARWLAQMALCESPLEDGSPCLSCTTCQRIADNRYPDVAIVQADGASIKVDQVRDLVADFSKSAMESDERFLIIEEADRMTPGASNALLKFLEEPPGASTVILLTTSLNRLLATIVSRCQVIHFRPQGPDQVAEKMVAAGIKAEDAALFSRLTQEVEEARTWSEDEEFMTLVQRLRYFKDLLSQGNINAYPYVQTHLKDLLKDRNQQTLALEILLELFRSDYGDGTLSVKGQQVATVLRAIQMHQSNVSIQNALEYIVLDLVL